MNVEARGPRGVTWLPRYCVATVTGYALSGPEGVEWPEAFRETYATRAIPKNLNPVWDDERREPERATGLGERELAWDRPRENERTNERTHPCPECPWT